jgi:acyl-CoA synthetase (AMP-forming)/AMP-acid ligase II
MVKGWLRTGDMAKKDRWGRIFFVDRVKDVIKCGGYSNKRKVTDVVR